MRCTQRLARTVGAVLALVVACAALLMPAASASVGAPLQITTYDTSPHTYDISAPLTRADSGPKSRRGPPVEPLAMTAGKAMSFPWVGVAANAGDDVVRALPRGGASLTQGRLDHIVYRHWSTSGFSGVGKFAEGTSARSLRSMIDDVARNGSMRPNTGGRPGTIFEQDMGQIIGMNGAGNATSRLRVVVAPDGTVVTAFPY